MTTQRIPLVAPVFSTLSSLNHREKLADNAVHLWLLDIDRFTAAHYTHAEQIMSSAERERAHKFIRGKNEYIASRWLLRKVLARYTGRAADQLIFLHTEKGKPYLPQDDIHFNLSHSGHWALLAVGSAGQIGVDIEAMHATRDLSGIAENYYHPREFAQLQTLDPAAQAVYFYQLWTLKEAFLKAIGTGISAGLEKIEFDLTGSKISAHIAASLEGNPEDSTCHSAAEWQFHQWALTAQDYCALASKSRQPLDLNWFDALAMPAFP